MEQQYNMKSPAVKRLMREAKELCEPTEEYYAQPVEDNLFEWHFTVRGPFDTAFEGGVYHGRIILPPEYPMKPPSIILLTPNGRFEVNKKICLSISGHHPESWQPSWSIRTALLAIIGFMPTQGLGAIGSLDYTSEERQDLAKRSQIWKCNICGPTNRLLRTQSMWPSKINEEAKILAQQISFKGENEQVNKKSEIQQLHQNGTTAPDDSGKHGMHHRSKNFQTDSATMQQQQKSNSPELASSRNNLWFYVIILLSTVIISLIIRRLFLL